MADLTIQAPDHPAAPLVVPSDALTPELVAELKRRGYIREDPPPAPSKRKAEK